ncbi:ciliogenesis and planar polarity effector 2 isoform X1 [Sceloporus undulatus]|uniref:ciliogenesis and planar polarity effector 2 isoform X1 n=1 Tax=Sceloporus undulatus TaxID=8520 RepID=UPI001C4D7CB5|nr:ciliogenesis and planar polarity effector 2 isoform X1 [Sceloporus undulatus]
MAEVPAGSVVEGGWLETAEGRELLGALLRERSRRRGRRSCSRRAFGLLERPLLPPGAAAADVAAYKVFVCGRSGVGKTALVAQAAGMEAAPAPQETIGIQTTPVFWPAKLRESGKALFFRFSFWDCGEAVLRKFDHILPSCLEKADGVLLLFSFTDRASFEDLPLQISRLEAAEGPPAPPLKMVVGTKYPSRLSAIRAPERPKPPGRLSAGAQRQLAFCLHRRRLFPWKAPGSSPPLSWPASLMSWHLEPGTFLESPPGILTPGSPQTVAQDAQFALDVELGNQGAPSTKRLLRARLLPRSASAFP